MKPANWTSRLLMLRPGEGRSVFFLAVIAALAGFGLAVGRASSDALFFKRYGVEYVPQMYALIALLMIPVGLGYAAFVDRLAPHRMFVHLLLGFAVLVGVSWLGMLSGADESAIALYFIAYGVISEILLTHFNLYATGFFDTQQAKRLLPVVMSISRLGAMMGGVFLGLAGTAMATEHAALVWSLCLALALLLVGWRHLGEAPLALIGRGRASSPAQMVREGLMFARHSRLMRITALGVFLLVLLLSIQEYLIGKIFAQHYQDERQLAAFFGWFSAVLNASVLVIQLFLSGRMIRRFGLKTMNLIYPLSTLLSFGLLTLSAGYWAAVLGRINTAGVLPGFRNTAAALFFRALPHYMQGRAQALITGLVLPFGLLGAALFLWLLPGAASLAWIAAGGLVFAAALLWVKLKKNQAYGESLVELVGQSVFARGGGLLAEPGGLDKAAASSLASLIPNADTLAEAINYADMLESLAPGYAGAALLEIYPVLSAEIQDSLLPRIARHAPPGWTTVALGAALRGDAHLLETTARLLLAADCPLASDQADRWLETGNPRLRAAAAVGCMHGAALTLKTKSRRVLEHLLASADPEDALAALDALAAMPHEELLPNIHPLLVAESARARSLALKIWSRCPQTDAGEALGRIEAALRDVSAEVRAAALCAAAQLQLSGMPALDWLGKALQDPDFRVRQAAQHCAEHFMPKHREKWLEALVQREADFDLTRILASALAVSDIESRASLLRQASERHVWHARSKLLIRENLAHAGNASGQEFQLLQQVLREEACRHLDVVLHILGCLDHSQQMRYILAGLASRDTHLWAQAIESAMQLKKEGRLFRDLAVMFEAERDGSQLGGEPPGGKGAPVAWRAWCQAHGSEWLAECAAYYFDKNRFAS